MIVDLYFRNFYPYDFFFLSTIIIFLEMVTVNSATEHQRGTLTIIKKYEDYMQSEIEGQNWGENY